MLLLTMIFVLACSLALAAPTVSKVPPTRSHVSVLPGPKFVPSPMPSAAPGEPTVKLVPTPQGLVTVVSTPSPSPSPNEEDAVAAATRTQDQYAKALQGLSVVNPLSDSPVGKSDSETPVTPESLQLQRLQKFMSTPFMQGYLRFIKSPSVVEAMTTVLTSHHQRTLLYAELALLVILPFFRAWRHSRCKHWTGKIWVNFYSLVGFILLSIVALPGVIIGEAYLKVLSGIAATVLERF